MAMESLPSPSTTAAGRADGDDDDDKKVGADPRFRLRRRGWRRHVSAAVTGARRRSLYPPCRDRDKVVVVVVVGTATKRQPLQLQTNEVMQTKKKKSDDDVAHQNIDSIHSQID